MKNTSKCGRLIQMTTRYFLRWRLSQISHPGDVQGVKFPIPHVHSTKSNSHGLTPPPPSPILGQTIDRCISFSLWWTNFLYQFISRYSTNHWFDRFSLLSLIATRGFGLFKATIGEDSRPRLLTANIQIADMKVCFKSKSSF